MTEQGRKKKQNIGKALSYGIWSVILIAYGVACTYLYYMQSNHKG